jgi:hypothetical protein
MERQKRIIIDGDDFKIELLEMDKAGIAVAEFWTNLPPKAKFKKLLKNILKEANERIERRKYLIGNTIPKQIDSKEDYKRD